MIYRFDFEGGYTGTLTATPLGNIGNLDRAHTNSEIVREGDKYVCYITNRATATLTRLVWPVCSNPYVQNSTQFTPPPFSYDQPGTYPVRLTVDEGMQTETSACRFITVLDCQLPVTEFADSVAYPEVYFTNQSTLDTAWLWNFNDGTTSTLENPVHSFPGPGSYNVCLTAYNDCGSQTFCDEVVLTCTPPEANYIFYVSYPDVYFSDTSTTTAFISRLWEFGDGDTSAEKYPVHSYSIAPGVYNACLTINDSCGISTFCQDIYYIQPKRPPFSTSTDPYNDRLVRFNDETVGSTTWQWEFGDGNSADIRNPVHLYPAYKTYNVCLTTGTSMSDSAFCDSIDVVSLYSSAWHNIASLYPNPASGQCFIGLTKAVASASLEIYDLTGICLKNISYSNILSNEPIAVDISGLSGGMYFVKFSFDSYEMTWKLIVR
jgi:PKD repeat protein